MKPIIENPNSSGQGFHPSSVTHPLRSVVMEEFSYRYSHSTPIGYPGPGGEQRWFLLHTFVLKYSNHQVHTVSLRTNENNPEHDQRWRTSCGAQKGKFGAGEQDLREHLMRKAKRFALPYPHDLSQFVSFRACGVDMRGKRLRPVNSESWNYIRCINLWKGSKWGIRADGTRQCLARITN